MGGPNRADVSNEINFERYFPTDLRNLIRKEDDKLKALIRKYRVEEEGYYSDEVNSLYGEEPENDPEAVYEESDTDSGSE